MVYTLNSFYKRCDFVYTTSTLLIPLRLYLCHFVYATAFMVAVEIKNMGASMGDSSGDPTSMPDSLPLAVAGL
jgi:hypothetical protein